MPTKKEAEPKAASEAEPPHEEAREDGDHDEAAKNESVAPLLPTTKNQGPRRSGAV